MSDWKIKYNGIDQENTYVCPCGNVTESEDYNNETGTIICSVCYNESPDVENITLEVD